MSKVYHLTDGREVAVEELVADTDTSFGSSRRDGIQRAKLQGLPLGQHSNTLYTDGHHERSKLNYPATIYRLPRLSHQISLPNLATSTIAVLKMDLQSEATCGQNIQTYQGENNGSLFQDEIDLIEQLPQQAVPMKLQIFRVCMIKMSGSHGRSTEFLENRRTNRKGLTDTVLHVAQSAQKHHNNQHYICSAARDAVIFEADARSILKQERQRRSSLYKPTIHVHVGQETLPRKYQSENYKRRRSMHKLCQNI
jgi:hypothetical protein